VGTNPPTAILLWRQEGQVVRRLSLQHPQRIHAQYLTADDRFVLSYCEDRLVRFWRTSDGVLERTVEVPAKAGGDLIQLCPDGRTALWVQWAPPGIAVQSSVQFLDLETGKFIGPIFNESGTIFQAPFSPDGRQLAFLDVNGAVAIRETRTGRVISTTIRHSSNLIWVEWDPEGRHLLTAGHNDEVLVWDVETGAQLLGPLRTPGGIAHIAHWSPDGRFIVTRGDDKRVRVWDASTGEAVTPFLKHSGDVVFAIMTPDRRLITASEPDQLRAWDLKETSLAPDALADYAMLLSGRRLSPNRAMLILKPEELAELNRSLRTRAPQLFE
jgi:WD40 repeat protein